MKKSNGNWAVRSAGGALACMLALGAPEAGADQVMDAHRRLAELEQRAQVLSSGFRETYAPDPNAAQRRVVEAQKLYTLRNYEAAAVLCLDVIEKYPQSRDYDDALYLLAESLYKDGDILSARRYFEEGVKKRTGYKSEQEALQRLVEISLRSGDYTNVDEYLDRLARIPPNQVQPSVPYVRGKYFFFRGRTNEALALFQAIPPGHPYYMQSRYFVGTIQVKNQDFASAIRSFDEVIRLPANNDGEKDIQDLSKLAIGRLLYDRGQFERARDFYASIQRQSKYFPDAMFESAWNSIKAKDYKSAYRALDLMLLQEPEGAQAPELRLLVGNLHLRLANFYLASNQFTSSLEEYEPVYRELVSRLEASKAEPKYFEQLISKGLDKFDIAAVFPARAFKVMAKEPDVAKLVGLADELGTLERGIRDSELLLSRLERAVQSGNRVSIFPDLGSARSRSTEILNQSIEVRRRFQTDARNMATAFLSAPDRGALETISGERAMLDQELKNLPLTQDAMRARAAQVTQQFVGVDAQASEVNVVLQSLSAELVAIEQYFIHSKGEQKIKPADLEQPVKEIKTDIESQRDALEKLRNEVIAAQQDAAMAGEAGAGDRHLTQRLVDLLRKEQEILSRARSGMRPEAGLQFDGYMSILQRADGIQTRLVDFDRRLEGIADGRLRSVRDQINEEKTALASASGKLDSVTSEGELVGGGLAQAMMNKATERFYDLTVQSDVGLVDVSWGIKDSKTQTVGKLINQQKLELQAVEDDFGALLREDDR